MHFKTAKRRAAQHDPAGAVCSLCAQDIYIGESVWRCGGMTVCRDCFTQFAEDMLRPFEMKLGEEMVE